MRLGPADFAMGVTVALVWGAGFVFAKAALDHFPPILLMSLRFAVTAMALVWFVRPPVAQFGRLFMVAIVAAAVQYSLTFTGLKHLDASAAVLIVQLEVPFLVLLGALFLGERPSRRKWLGIAIAFGGVAVMFGGPRLSQDWVFGLMVLGGAFTWAVGQAMIRALAEIDGLTVTAWVAVFAAPQLAAMSLVFERDHLAAILAADWVVWATVFYLGLVMTAFGYGLWNSLLRRHPLGAVAPFLLLLPVFSIAGSILLLGERLTWPILAGGAAVMAGVALIVAERRPPRVEPEVI